MHEFVSQLERIVRAHELDFEPTPGFGKYKPFLEHAVAHPAKMNTELLEFLIERFTSCGEVILDPMAGTGSTGVVAALYGRDAIQVEIEPKFFEWMEKAKENVKKSPSLIPKGEITNILGDARALSMLISNASVDVIITSPPYADAKKGKADAEAMAERWDRKFREVGERWNSWGKTWKTEGRLRALEALGSGYSESEDNIGNLPFGDCDAINYLTKYNGDEEFDDLIKRLMKCGKPTYLSEMLKVYKEMYKILKPKGKAIIVVKPFIRDKKVVDLPYYTWLLMKCAGFKLVELYKLRLKGASFWRVIYYRKFPEVPRINHEYVLVCEKS